MISLNSYELEDAILTYVADKYKIDLGKDPYVEVFIKQKVTTQEKTKTGKPKKGGRVKTKAVEIYIEPYSDNKETTVELYLELREK